MSIGFWQILILSGVSGGFPIPLIVALVIFFKKRKREKMILKREIKKFLWVNFSLEGRIHREDYWYYGYGLYWIANTVILLIFFLIFFIVHKLFNFWFTPLFYFLFCLSYGMKFFANKIKRLHDNNKSGSFLLWTLIPILGQLFGLYIFITNWFMRGTIGSNDFGDDPVKKDITPIITIKDAAKTFGLLLIVSALIAGYVFLVTLIT